MMPLTGVPDVRSRGALEFLKGTFRALRTPYCA